MRNGVAIQYGDVAPEAKENFAPTASESLFDDISELQQYNLSFPNYNNPCEMYAVPLDGETQLLPENNESLNVGLVSEQLSEQDGTFDTPIVLTLESQGQYTSQGFTFTFDTYNEIYATDINIKWYRVIEGVETLLDDEDFAPDQAFYFCQNQVNNFNKVVITFKSINMPENRLRLRVIDYGYGTMFYGDELRSVTLIQEIDPISSQISINTADFTLDSDSIEYNFQQKQPLSVYFNGTLRATTFVKSSKRKARFLWEVQSEDYIGIMSETPFGGGLYTDKNVVELMEEIFDIAKVPYNISEDFDNLTVTGYIPYTNCREALMQVAFAIMAVVDTSNSNKVEVYQLDTTPTQTIPLDRIMQGQNFEEGNRVTAVEVVAHAYKPIQERVEAYSAEKSGTGQNIFVRFAEPLHSLAIWLGDIVEYGANYAIISTTDNDCYLEGFKYEHTETAHRRNNPIVLATDKENVITIDQATLVSANNVDNVLERCYNWIVRTDTTNLKIVEGKTVIENGRVKYGQKKYGTFKYGEELPPTIVYDEPVNVGETIRAETEYKGVVEGIAIKQTYNLNGNIIIKDTVLR